MVHKILNSWGDSTLLVVTITYHLHRAVYGFVSILESFTDILLYWFPFYFFLKTVLLLWLMLPTFNVKMFPKSPKVPQQ